MGATSEKIISMIYGIKPYQDGIQEDTNLIESGVLDSLALLVLVGELESVFAIEIEAEDLLPENFQTVTDIQNLVMAKNRDCTR